MAAQELESGSVGSSDLRKQVEKLTREKEEVLEKAKQAVEELTGQLARTRSAREKDLQRRVTTCEEAINNLKQQAAIDLQVSNALRSTRSTFVVSSFDSLRGLCRSRTFSRSGCSSWNRRTASNRRWKQ